jgi:serine/threonine protein kinase
MTSVKGSKIGTAKKDGMDAIQLRQRINVHAKDAVTEQFRDASLPDLSSRFPIFSTQDVVKGRYLGKGNFGTVFEVLALDGGNESSTSSSASTKKMHQNRKWFQQRPKTIPTQLSTPSTHMDGYSIDDDENYDFESEDGDEILSLTMNDTSEPQRTRHLTPEARLKKKQDDARVFMNEHCLRESNGKPRYAVKILRPEVLNDPTTLYYQGIMDMATETRLLSSLQHPHIIKLRGIGSESFSEHYFLILDRLYQTLEQRWKQWQKLQHRYTSAWGLLDRGGRKRAALWEERIICAHDLASGLAYLHSRSVIHRDIKSDNIGFDVRGDIKVSCNSGHTEKRS